MRENEKIFRECIEYSGASLTPADARIFGDILARISQEVFCTVADVKSSSATVHRVWPFVALTRVMTLHVPVDGIDIRSLPLKGPLLIIPHMVLA